MAVLRGGVMATTTSAAEMRLAKIASAMVAQVASTGKHAHQRLAHGLELVLQSTEGHFRLALGREAVYPSDTEVPVCREAFGVPDGAEEGKVLKTRHHPKTGRVIAYHVVEMTWRMWDGGDRK